MPKSLPILCQVLSYSDGNLPKATIISNRFASETAENELMCALIQQTPEKRVFKCFGIKNAEKKQKNSCLQKLPTKLMIIQNSLKVP